MQALTAVKKAYPPCRGVKRLSYSSGWYKISRTRIPVWLLEQARQLGTNERDLLATYPTLRAEDLANAWAYVRVHAEAIGKQIQDNEAA